MNSISIVIPAYNESGLIEETVAEIIDCLSSLTVAYELIIVDDGSTDKTGEIAEKIALWYQHISVIHHRTNKGVGEVLKGKPVAFDRCGILAFNLSVLDL